MKARLAGIAFSGIKHTGKPKLRMKESGAVSKKMRLRNSCSHASTRMLAGNKAGLIRKQILHAAGKMAPGVSIISY